MKNADQPAMPITMTEFQIKAADVMGLDIKTFGMTKREVMAMHMMSTLLNSPSGANALALMRNEIIVEYECEDDDFELTKEWAQASKELNALSIVAMCCADSLLNVLAEG